MPKYQMVEINITPMKGVNINDPTMKEFVVLIFNDYSKPNTQNLKNTPYLVRFF
jgi:hypothetical protein